MDNKLEQALSVDLIDTCRKAGADLEKRYDGYRSSCPLHKGEGNNNFSVYFDSGKWKWKCFSGACGGGDIIDFVMHWQSVDWKGAVEYLTGGSPITTEDAARLATQNKIFAEEHKRKKELEYNDALDKLWRARLWENYYHNLLENNQARDLWRGRGIPDVFQDIWQLGYSSEFIYYSDDVRYTSPTLAIPIFSIGGTDPINIRHRLLRPANPGDKYRPERAGLRAAPFIADPQNEHERVLVVEGEIKAMVSYVALDDVGLQVYGIPGKNNFTALMDKLQGCDVYILFDPDAGEQAIRAAQAVKGKVINMQIKVDDAINAGYLTPDGLRRMMRSARRYYG